MARISKSSRSSTVSSPNIELPPAAVPAAKGDPAAPNSFTSLSTMAALLSPPAYTIIQLNGVNNYTQNSDGNFRIQGNSANNVITVAAASTGSDYLEGGAGNDTLNAAGSDDILDGGAGTDTLNGNAGNDILRGGAGADTLNGGDGIDTADYSTSAAAVTISLPSDPVRTSRGSGGDATNDTLSGIENLTGSAGDDRLTGNRLDNQLVGNAGEDILRGMDGNDLLIGDAMIDADANGVPDDENMDGVPDGVDEDQAGADDFLDGGFGDDRLYGGGGNDTLNAGFGNDVLHGGYGDDMLNASDGDDILDGGEGNDMLIGSLGNDILRGGGGDDTLNASIGDDVLDGGDGRDELLAGTGDDILNGGAGDDTLNGGGDDGDPLNGGDILNGDAGDDTLIGGSGADHMDGGAGIDTASYASGGAVGIDLGTGGVSGAAAGDVLLNIENLVGSGQDDILVGDNNNNTLTGGAGADLLVGQGGFDTADYSGSAAGVVIQLNSTVADPLAEGTGSGGAAEGDRIQLIERIIGSAFADTFTGGELADTFMGGGGADVINGGLGTDTAEYSSSAVGVTVTLADDGSGIGVGGDADGDALNSIENLIGSKLDDTLIGNAGLNRLEGGAGNDYFRSGAGGSSALPTPVVEFVIGGTGVDTVDYSQSAAAVVARLSDSLTSGNLSTGGEADGDVLVTMENIIGSAFDDQLFGASAANRLDGGAGNDFLIGGAGADILIGGLGTDTAVYQTSGAGVTIVLDNTGAALGVGGDAQGDQLSTIENLIGSNFDDVLIGNASVNRLEGGGGNDLFRSGAGGVANAAGPLEFLLGGDGIDTVDYSTSSSAVFARLSSSGTSGFISQNGDAAGDVLLQMENVIGSNFGDLLHGTELANRIEGGDGNDTLVGFAGADVLIGGNGTDTADYSQSAAGVSVALSATGTTTGSSGDAAGDQLTGIESLIGSNGNDTLLGSAAGNKLVSGSGNDQMRGGSGADILSATGTGAKTLFGDGLVDGGTAGQDTFRILGGTGNVIVDYQAGEDLFLNSLNATGGIALTAISIGGVATWAGRFTGSTHQTFVALGAQSTMSQTDATAMLTTLVNQDLFVDANLIA